ncbi:MAG: tryptophan synthase subunit alpha [Chthoniobacterales bacterium]|nr:tryptophan synthase subunit alpha [Chthoniobacterales bacterium]
MSALGESFARLTKGEAAGFIPFLLAGDPDLETTAELLRALSRLAPVAMELGVPFSDPTADGPIIQRAAQRALARGVSLARIFQMLEKLRPNELAPIVLFSYYNPIFQFGIKAFARKVSGLGLAGVLAVDLPAEAAAPLQKQLRQRNVDLIFLVTPTTSAKRLEKIARLASGFLYVVARTGVTGTARTLTDESQELVARLRRVTDLPVAVGFGITAGTQARRVRRYAEAAVVGSRLVEEAAQKASSRDALVRAVSKCARQFV